MGIKGDEFYRMQAAQEKAAWEKSQKVNSQNSGSMSGSGDVPPPKTAQAQPKGPLRPGADGARCPSEIAAEG